MSRKPSDLSVLILSFAIVLLIAVWILPILAPVVFIPFILILLSLGGGLFSFWWILITVLEFFLWIELIVKDVSIFLIILNVFVYIVMLIVTGKEIPMSNKKNIKDVNNMSGYEFEYYCADLLRKSGFSNVRVTPGSGDQGVDILASKNGKRYAVQCKKYSSPLSNKPVQEVVAGKQFYGCDVAVVMTNSTFTASAVSLAQATGVELWDRIT